MQARHVGRDAETIRPSMLGRQYDQACAVRQVRTLEEVIPLTLQQLRAVASAHPSCLTNQSSKLEGMLTHELKCATLRERERARARERARERGGAGKGEGEGEGERGARTHRGRSGLFLPEVACSF